MTITLFNCSKCSTGRILLAMTTIFVMCIVLVLASETNTMNSTAFSGVKCCAGTRSAGASSSRSVGGGHNPQTHMALS